MIGVDATGASSPSLEPSDVSIVATSAAKTAPESAVQPFNEVLSEQKTGLHRERDAKQASPVDASEAGGALNSPIPSTSSPSTPSRAGQADTVAAPVLASGADARTSVASAPSTTPQIASGVDPTIVAKVAAQHPTVDTAASAPVLASGADARTSVASAPSTTPQIASGVDPTIVAKVEAQHPTIDTAASAPVLASGADARTIVASAPSTTPQIANGVDPTIVAKVAAQQVGVRSSNPVGPTSSLDNPSLPASSAATINAHVGVVNASAPGRYSETPYAAMRTDPTGSGDRQGTPASHVSPSTIASFEVRSGEVAKVGATFASTQASDPPAPASRVHESATSSDGTKLPTTSKGNEVKKDVDVSSGLRTQFDRSVETGTSLGSVASTTSSSSTSASTSAISIDVENLSGTISRPLSEGNGIYSLVVALHPSELGHVQAVMSLNGNDLQVSITPQSSVGHQALATTVENLRSELARGGLNVNVTLHDAGSQTHGQARENGANAPTDSSGTNDGSSAPSSPSVLTTSQIHLVL